MLEDEEEAETIIIIRISVITIIVHAIKNILRFFLSDHIFFKVFFIVKQKFEIDKLNLEQKVDEDEDEVLLSYF